MSSRTLAACGQCGALIRWTRTDAGKLSAMNPRSDPAGNTAVFCDALGVWRSRRPTEELPLAPWEKLHVPHVATCTPAIRSIPLPAAVADLSAYRRNRGAPRR